jgi:hypothetical protein
MAEISAAARFMAEREPRSRDAADECRRNEPYVLSRWAGRTTLFAGSDSGGERAAAIYTLIGTALCRTRHSAVHAVLPTMPNDSPMLLWRVRRCRLLPGTDE